MVGGTNLLVRLRNSWGWTEEIQTGERELSSVMHEALPYMLSH